jgi:UDP-3-O-[3-hydroxymyristoyl] glucosamine N-acyltransferase
MPMRLDELANAIGATLSGDGSLDIWSVATLKDAQPGQVSFLHNPRYAELMDSTTASAVITGQGVRSDRLAILTSTHPHLAYARAVEALHGHRQHSYQGVHPQAFVDPTAVIGSGTVIYPFAYVGPGARVGSDCILYPNVTIYDHCELGDRVIVHAGASIGHDGYGFATHQGVHHKIIHSGGVRIEDDVEIGPCTTIARGVPGDTIIGQGTKIDALVIIGHNVRIGPGCLLVGQSGVAGSTELGRHVTLAGQAGVIGHLRIGDQATIAAKLLVTRSVEDEETVMGSPALPAPRARRSIVVFAHLQELTERVRTLERRLKVQSGESKSRSK